MRTALMVMICCLWMTVAWAKTVKIPTGSIDPNQLHEELLAARPEWRGTERPDGTFTNPLLRVEFTDEEITLTIPDEADEAVVWSVVRSHVPGRRADKAAGRVPPPSPLALEARVRQLEAALGLQE